MYWTVVAVLICYAGSASAEPIEPPIPVLTTEPGIRYLPVDPRPTVQLEVFIELNCGDSNAAWPILKQVQATYGSSQLDLLVQQFPMPHHRNAHISTQGLNVIQHWNPAFTFDYAEAVLAANQQFSTANTVNKTETQVIEELADIAVATTGIDRDFFINDLPNRRGYTTSIWKYANKRNVAGTPTYFVNGVDVVVGTDFVPTYEDWIAFFDPIINAP